LRIRIETKTKSGFGIKIEPRLNSKIKIRIKKIIENKKSVKPKARFNCYLKIKIGTETKFDF